MGVDFYSCHVCDEVFDDCGHLYNECEECGKRICFWCQEEMGMRSDTKYFSEGVMPLGEYWESETWTGTDRGVHTTYRLVACPYCKNEVIDDEKVLKYLLAKLGLTKDDVINEFKSQHKEGDA